MDDALVPLYFYKALERSLTVLILVVMDDALVLFGKAIRGEYRESLNPCCNG